MWPGTDRSSPPRISTSVWPSAARPSSAPSTSIESTERLGAEARDRLGAVDEQDDQRDELDEGKAALDPEQMRHVVASLGLMVSKLAPTTTPTTSSAAVDEGQPRARDRQRAEQRLHQVDAARAEEGGDQAAATAAELRAAQRDRRERDQRVLGEAGGLGGLHQGGQCDAGDRRERAAERVGDDARERDVHAGTERGRVVAPGRVEVAMQGRARQREPDRQRRRDEEQAARDRADLVAEVREPADVRRALRGSARSSRSRPRARRTCTASRSPAGSEARRPACR